NHLFSLNWWNLEYPKEWRELDSLASPPFAGFAECQGTCGGGQALSDPSQFPLAFDVMSGLQHTKVMFDNTFSPVCGNLDTPYPPFTAFTCGDVLWYQMGVFMMGF